MRLLYPALSPSSTWLAAPLPCHVIIAPLATPGARRHPRRTDIVLRGPQRRLPAKAPLLRHRRHYCGTGATIAAQAPLLRHRRHCCGTGGTVAPQAASFSIPAGQGNVLQGPGAFDVDNRTDVRYNILTHQPARKGRSTSSCDPTCTSGTGVCYGAHRYKSRYTAHVGLLWHPS
jgi:hypothetical protein